MVNHIHIIVKTVFASLLLWHRPVACADLSRYLIEGAIHQLSVLTSSLAIAVPPLQLCADRLLQISGVKTDQS